MTSQERATKPVLPDGEAFKKHLQARHFRGKLWEYFFLLSIIVGMVALVALFGNIINDAFGYTLIEDKVNPATLTEDGRPLDELSIEELTTIFNANLNLNRRRVIMRDLTLGGAFENQTFVSAPVSELFEGLNYPEDLADLTVRDLDEAQVGELIVSNLADGGLIDLVTTEIVGRKIIKVWTLSESLFEFGKIEAYAAELPHARLEFRSWISLDFLTSPMSSNADVAGIRTAILGSAWLISLTILFSFPIGVGAAIYLEEYAVYTPWERLKEPNVTPRVVFAVLSSMFNRFIDLNIRNLSGVPSIIYGLLGLAIFVYGLSEFTGGRSVLSGSLTMALLILPVIIINAQEALRAVPYSIREASYGLGATRWQTIWHQVLPAALPGVLTGTILAMSRAVGETAPLVVIGATTYITLDPTGPRSVFTVLPIQIYNWTKRPEAQFQDIAAATILVLMALLLVLNASAIILRQQFRRKLQG